MVPRTHWGLSVRAVDVERMTMTRDVEVRLGGRREHHKPRQPTPGAAVREWNWPRHADRVRIEPECHCPLRRGQPHRAGEDTVIDSIEHGCLTLDSVGIGDPTVFRPMILIAARIARITIEGVVGH